MLEQIILVGAYLCNNTFVSTIFGGQPNGNWTVCSGTRHRKVCLGFLLKIILDEIFDNVA